MNMRLSISFLLLVWVWSFTAFAQNVNLQSAQKMLEEGRYQEAADQFRQLLQGNDKDLKSNFGLGVALIEGNRDLSEGIRRLAFVTSKGGPIDAHFYLARGYQLRYEFELAIASFEKYLKSGKNSQLAERAKIYIAQSRASIPLSNKIFAVKIVSKQKSIHDQSLSLYHHGKDVGAIGRNKDFFSSGVDPDGLFYRTERGDLIYFSNKNTNGDVDLYKMEQLIDGWSEAESLAALNTEANEKMPFLMLDGTSLYFSSDREGGMGGLDIYKSTYDAETRMFLDPVNMGVPFNSPFDDFLFVADEFQNRAWFSSNRETYGDSSMVYELVWDQSVIRNLVSEKSEISLAAALNVETGLQKRPTSSEPFTQTKRIGQKVRLFHFQVNDSIAYGNWEDFRSEQARSLFKNTYALIQKMDSLTSEMTIQRRVFQQTQSETIRNQAVSQILKNEKELYGLQAVVAQEEQKVREAELAHIKQNSATDQPLIGVGPKQSKLPDNLDELLRKEHFTFYTDIEFERQLKEWQLMYSRLFDAQDVAALVRADSLLVWANLLNLEANMIPERILKQSTESNRIDLLVKDADQPEQMMAKAKEYKTSALQLFHYVYEQKNALFTRKITSILEQNTTFDGAVLVDYQARCDAYFRQANILATNVADGGYAAYEKAGTLKREGVNLQIQALMRYLRHLDGVETLPVRETSLISGNVDQVKDVPVESGLENQVKETVTVNNPVQSNAQAAGVIYKIQMGLFRKPPSEQSLNGLPKVDSILVPERSASKYFCGAFASYNEAISFIPTVRERGFEGAFVVAFYENEQISLAKAKELEK